MLPPVAPHFHPDAQPTACFSIQAKAEPGAMPRVLELFAKRGMVPTSWHSHVSGDDLTIDVRVFGLDRVAAARIAAGLRQIVCIGAVLTSEQGSLG